jgi:hypothetical protein
MSIGAAARGVRGGCAGACAAWAAPARESAASKASVRGFRVLGFMVRSLWGFVADGSRYFAFDTSWYTASMNCAVVQKPESAPKRGS